MPSMVRETWWRSELRVGEFNFRPLWQGTATDFSTLETPSPSNFQRNGVIVIVYISRWRHSVDFILLVVSLQEGSNSFREHLETVDNMDQDQKSGRGRGRHRRGCGCSEKLGEPPDVWRKTKVRRLLPSLWCRRKCIYPSSRSQKYSSLPCGVGISEALCKVLSY